jgi:hypothetical protein
MAIVRHISDDSYYEVGPAGEKTRLYVREGEHDAVLLPADVDVIRLRADLEEIAKRSKRSA